MARVKLSRDKKVEGEASSEAGAEEAASEIPVTPAASFTARPEWIPLAPISVDSLEHAGSRFARPLTGEMAARHEELSLSAAPTLKYSDDASRLLSEIAVILGESRDDIPFKNRTVSQIPFSTVLGELSRVDGDGLVFSESYPRYRADPATFNAADPFDSLPPETAAKQALLAKTTAEFNALLDELRRYAEDPLAHPLLRVLAVISSYDAILNFQSLFAGVTQDKIDPYLDASKALKDQALAAEALPEDAVLERRYAQLNALIGAAELVTQMNLEFFMAEADQAAKDTFAAAAASRRKNAESLLAGLIDATEASAWDRITADVLTALKSETGPVPFLPDTMAAMHLAESALNGEWAKLYAKAYLVSDLSVPRGVDGDLPAELLWHLPQVFETREEQALFESILAYHVRLSDEEPEARPAESKKLFDALEKIVSEEVGLIADFENDVANPGAYLTAAADEILPAAGDEAAARFSEAAIKQHPSRANIGFKAKALREDTLVVDQLAAYEIFNGTVVAKALSDELIAVSRGILSGESPYLAGPELSAAEAALFSYRLRESELKEKYPDLSFADFQDSWIRNATPDLIRQDLVTTLAPLVHLVFDALSDVISIDDFVAKLTSYLASFQMEMSPAVLAQFREFFRAVLDVVGKTDGEHGLVLQSAAEAEIPELQAEAFVERLEETMSALECVLTETASGPWSAAQGRIIQKIAVRNARKDVSDVSEVVGLAQGLMAGFAGAATEIKPSLQGWDSYLGFTAKLASLDPELTFGMIIRRFVEGDTTAADFAAALDSVTLPQTQAVAEKLLSAELLPAIDVLENEALYRLGPYQALRFVNRMRYAFYRLNGLVQDLKIRQERLENPLESLIRQGLERFYGELETGWPSIEGLPERSLLDEEDTAADREFLPGGSYYLDRDDLQKLFSKGEDQPVLVKIAKITQFFLDYEQGYYRYFAPLAFEKNAEGVEIKAVRDHAYLNQFASLMKDFAASAKLFLENDAALDEDTKSYYRDVIRVASEVEKNIEDFVTTPPAMPFWIVEDGVSARVMPQEVIQNPTVPAVQDDSEALRTSVKSRLYQAQHAPFDAFKPLMASGEFTSWARGELSTLEFKAADFESWSTEELVELKVNLSQYALPSGDANRLGLMLDHVVKVRQNLYEYETDSGAYFAAISQILNDFLLRDTSESSLRMGLVCHDNPEAIENSDPELFFALEEEKMLCQALQERLAAHPEEAVGIATEMAFRKKRYNALLLQRLHPRLVPSVYGETARRASSLAFDAATPGLVENSLSVIAVAEKSLELARVPETPDWFEGYLNTAALPEWLYVCGRLTEIAYGTYGVSSTARLNDLDYALWTLSASDMTAIAVASFPDFIAALPARTKEGLALQCGVLSERGKDFLATLTRAEKIWVPARICQIVLMQERVRQKKSQDRYFEHVRDTETDAFLAGLDADAAKALIKRLAEHVSPEAALNLKGRADDAEPLSQALRAAYSPGSATRSLAKTSGVVMALRSFGPAERIYALEILSRRLADEGEGKSLADEITRAFSGYFDPQAVTDLLSGPEATSLSSYELKEVYRHLHSLVTVDYQARAYGLVHDVLHTERGLLDYDLTLEANDMDQIWTWLDDVLTGPITSLSSEGLAEIVARMDAAIAADLGYDERLKRRLLDPAATYVLKKSLEDVLALYDKASPLDADDVVRRELIRFVYDALFSPFNAEDYVERRHHSQYNVNAVYPSAPRYSVGKYFTLENFHRAYQALGLRRVTDGDVLKSVQASLGVFIQALSEEEGRVESLVLGSWNDKVGLAALLPVVERLTQAAKGHYEIHEPENAGVASAVLDDLAKRLKDRHEELVAEESLAKLHDIWSRGKTLPVGADFIGAYLQVGEDLTRSERATSEKLRAALKDDLKTLAVGLRDKGDDARATRSDLLRRVGEALLVTGGKEARTEVSFVAKVQRSLATLKIFIHGEIAALQGRTKNLGAVFDDLHEAFYGAGEGGKHELRPTALTARAKENLSALDRSEAQIVLDRMHRIEQAVTKTSVMKILAPGRAEKLRALTSEITSIIMGNL